MTDKTIGVVERSLDDARTLATFLATLGLIVPRRTRGLGVIGVAIVLSRAHGFAIRRLEAELLRLFDERQAITPRIDDLEKIVAPMIRDAGRVTELARLAGGTLVRLEVLEAVVYYLADDPAEPAPPRVARALAMLRERAEADASTANGPTLIRTDERSTEAR